MAYKHGVYGSVIPFAGTLPIAADGTIPVYVGTAPVQRLNAAATSGYDYTATVNKPLLISSYSDAVSKIGYSTDWEKFTLCEAVSAHFLNDQNPIGPIIVINMLSPATHKTTVSPASVALVGTTVPKVGYIDDAGVILESVVATSEGVTFESGDVVVEFEDEKVKITVNKTDFAPSTVTVGYNKVDTLDATLTATVFETAIAAIDLCSISLNIIPNVLLAPGYSHKPTYHAKMIAKAVNKISTKRGITCISDLDSDNETTIAEVLVWKTGNNYTNKLDKVCWPMADYAGTQYHLSTLCMVAMQQTDTTNGGFPCESPSNKKILATSMVLADGSAIAIDEVNANLLNASGITTMNYIGGALRLWGPHMANYDYSNIDNINPEDRSDASVRIAIYLPNTLQENYLDMIDTPFTRREIDAVKATVQVWLNSLVNSGKLLYALIDFVATDNPDSDIINGDFVFSVTRTDAPNAKSITFAVQYTTTGLSTLTGGE